MQSRLRRGMRGNFLLLVVAANVVGLRAQQGSPPPSATGNIMGFGAQAAAAEAGVETKFKALISPDEARKFHREFTAEPHPAGTARNNELAQYIAGAWKKQGLEDVVVHRYDVLNSSPRELALEMVSPIQFKASLREAADPNDPDSANPRVKSTHNFLWSDRIRHAGGGYRRRAAARPARNCAASGFCVARWRRDRVHFARLSVRAPPQRTA